MFCAYTGSFFCAKIRATKERRKAMRKNEEPQLSQVMMVLQNINDNLRRIIDKLETQKDGATYKHIVVVKKEKVGEK